MQYMLDAAKVLSACRRVLKWSFVCEYFMPTGRDKAIFIFLLKVWTVRLAVQCLG